VSAIQVTALLLVAAGGTTVALLRDPVRQAVAVSIYGLLLAALFFAVQAPDVGLSQLAVGAVALPLMILLALAKAQRTRPRG
jgi:uncharacterized MnhB-related membrane protein